MTSPSPNQGAEKMKTVVIWRVDELMIDGFEEEWSDILKMLPRSIQIIMCVDTMPLRVLRLVGGCMKNPLEIHSPHPRLTLDRVQQFYINVHNAVQCFLPYLLKNSMIDCRSHLLGTENGCSIELVWVVE